MLRCPLGVFNPRLFFSPGILPAHLQLGLAATPPGFKSGLSSRTGIRRIQTGTETAISIRNCLFCLPEAIIQALPLRAKSIHNDAFCRMGFTTRLSSRSHYGSSFGADCWSGPDCYCPPGQASAAVKKKNGRLRPFRWSYGLFCSISRNDSRL